MFNLYTFYGKRKMKLNLMKRQWAMKKLLVKDIKNYPLYPILTAFLEICTQTNIQIEGQPWLSDDEHPLLLQTHQLWRKTLSSP